LFSSAVCVRFGVSRGILFDLAHRVAVKEPLAAIGAFVKFQIGHGVALTLKLAREVAPHGLEFAAAASWASGYLEHIKLLTLLVWTRRGNKTFRRLLRSP